jgi:hypothetical protein
MRLNPATPLVSKLQIRLREEQFQLFLTLGVALLVRLAFVPFIQRVDWDGFFYLGYAQNILRGDWLGVKPQWTPYPLVYPAAIAAVSLFGVNLEAAGLIVSFVAGVLVVIPTYKVAGLLGGPRTALFAALLVALNPWLVSSSISIYSEALFILVWMCLLWIYVRNATRQTTCWFLGVTLLASLVLVLIRPIGLALLVGGVLIALLYPKLQKYWMLVYGVILALSLIVYGLYSDAVSMHLLQLTGSPQPSYALQEISRGLVEYVDKNGLREQVLVYAPGVQTSEFFVANVLPLMRKYVSVMLDQFTQGVIAFETGRNLSVFPLYAWTFAVLGLWTFHHPHLKIIPLLAVVPYVILIPLFTSSLRYYYPVIPVFLIYVALGFETLFKMGYRRVGMTAALLLFGLSSLQMYQLNPHVQPVPVDSYKVAGLWLREHYKPEVVISAHPAPAFYAGAELQWLTTDPIETQFNKIVKSQAEQTILVLGTPVETLFNNAQDQAFAATHLRLVYSIPPSKTVAVYAYQLTSSQ